MGEALQIRVTAVTWNEDLLEKLWPQLTELAFSVPIKHEKHGVLEMVRALHEGLQFLPWSEARRKAMGPGIEEKPPASSRRWKTPWLTGSHVRPTF